MRTLRLGLTGDDVSAWQNFLRGRDPYSELVVTGSFNDDTLAATRDFQASVRLNADGVVGTLTYAAAMNVGFGVVTDDAAQEDGPSWPPPPDFAPMQYDERGKVFGNFNYIVGSGGAIVIAAGWANKNITKVSFPEPIGKHSSDLFHTLIATQVSGLFAAWHEAGLWSQLLTWDGSWAPRFIRGSDTVLSNHSWGTAFDVNFAWNQLGHTPALKGKPGSVRELVGIANEHGFFWGGHFGILSGNLKRIDGMHFEIAHLV